MRMQNFLRASVNWLRVGWCWVPAGLPALLIGCTAVPMTSGSALAQEGDRASVFDEEISGTSADSQLMFEIMIAELAGRRGQLDVALDGYLRAYPRSTDARVAERAARLAIYARFWGEADAAVGYWLDLESDASDALELRAQIRLRQGRIETAADAFAEFIDRSPDAGSAWEEAGAVLQTDPDPALARAVAEVLAEISPDSAAAQLLLARLALAAGDLPATDVAIARTLELDPGNPEARLIRAQREANEGDIDAALETLAQARATNPDDPRLKLGEAQLMIEAGLIVEAIDALKNIGDDLQADSSAADPETLLTIGLLSLQVGQLDDAERWFSALLQTGEYSGQALFQLARISDLSGETTDAIDRYESVPPGDLYISSQIRAAELQASGGDVQSARERLQTLRVNVPDPMIMPQIVAAEGRMMQELGEYELALEVYSSGLDEFPDSSVLLYARALAADSVGRSEILEEDLTHLIDAEPDNAHALNALGYHYVDNNIELEDAATYIEKAIKLRPDDPAIMDSLGWLRYRQGRNAEAIELLTQAIELLPDPEIAAHLVEVLWHEGREDEAKAVHADALSRAPDDERLLDLLDTLSQ